MTLADERIYDDEYDTYEPLSDEDFDQLPLESSKTEVVVEPDSKLDSEVQESKDAVTFTKDQKHAKSPNKFKIKMQNVTEEEYNYVQWYSEPTHINHHIDSQRIGSDSQNKGSGDDLSAQSSSYEEGYSGDRDHYSHHHSDDQHYDVYHDDPPRHHDHHEGYSERDPTNHDHDNHDGHYHYDHDGAQVHSFHHTKTSSGEEKSAFPEKRKMKKIRKKCPHSKNKKEPSGSAGHIVHSLSETGPEISHYDSKVPGAVTQARFNMSPNLASISPHLAPSGLTGPHLHTTPRARYFNQKAGKGNHIHLHNHHHHYNAEGKRIMLDNDPAGQGMGNLMQSLGKLRSLLPIALAGMAAKHNQAVQGFQQSQSSQGVHLPTENGVPDVKLAQDSPKLGYHYTGPHNSYGRKTYYRMKPGESDSSSIENSRPYGSGESTQDAPYPNDGAYNHDVPHPNDGVFDIGSDMLKYGAGPYGTDEFQDGGNKHYPNEVSLGVGKDPHQGRYHPDSPSQTGYGLTDSHSNTGNGPKDPPSHGGYEYKDSQSNVGYGHTDSHSNSGYGHIDSHPHDGPSPGPYHDHPADYDSGPKDTYSPDYEEKAPYVPYDQIKANREKDFGEGFGLRQIPPHSSEQPYDNIGGLQSEPSHPPPEDSVSYVQDGVDQHFYDPEKDYKYRDLKPEPDPLSIPKNARVIEHYIRLDPMYYKMFQQIPMDMPARFPPAPGFQQHIPVHKLIPNPLKMPNHVAPPVAAHPNRHLNEMLHAYQSRNVYRKWW